MPDKPHRHLIIVQAVMITSQQDTIAAIATAPGEAAIAIVRLSGPQALAIADRVAVCRPPKPSQRPPRTFVRARIVAADTAAEHNPEFIDEAIVLLFRAPHSFTRQDVVEFQCHGGNLAARRIYRVLLDQGARPAAPGEFTRRAFLNGRIDLVGAEAVMDLIRAQTLRAATVAAEQLQGSLSIVLTNIYDETLAVLAELEARLDFPEEDLPDCRSEDWIICLRRIAQTTDALLATWDQGRLVREGAMVVIAGATNAGKSTLLNSLLGHTRAIVNPSPGTTRDSIEAGLQINGIPVRLIDTAGYRQTDCDIEQDGMERTDRLRHAADILIYVIDASRPTQTIDLNNLSEADPDRTLIVFNKIDLGRQIRASAYPPYPSAATTLTMPGSHAVADVRQALADLLASGSNSHPTPVLISERHRNLLLKAKTALDEADQLLKAGEERHVMAAVALREVMTVLDECLGRTFNEHLLDTVFSKFCIGK